MMTEEDSNVVISLGLENWELEMGTSGIVRDLGFLEIKRTECLD